MSDFPDDIWEAARECLSAIIASGVSIDALEQDAARQVIAATLLREREQLQADVIAAVAEETEDCRRRVFAAIKRGFTQ